MTVEFKNLGVILNDIRFRIKSITTIQDEIKIVAETGQENYIRLNEWFDHINSRRNNNYKREIYFSNSVKLLGVFPIDYDFTAYSMKVIFSVDSIIGDINLINLQYERTEKLKRLNILCQV